MFPGEAKVAPPSRVALIEPEPVAAMELPVGTVREPGRVREEDSPGLG
jgi:hypothetical protein